MTSSRSRHAANSGDEIRRGLILENGTNIRLIDFLSMMLKRRSSHIATLAEPSSAPSVTFAAIRRCVFRPGEAITRSARLLHIENNR